MFSLIFLTGEIIIISYLFGKRSLTMMSKKSDKTSRSWISSRMMWLVPKSNLGEKDRVNHLKYQSSKKSIGWHTKSNFTNTFSIPFKFNFLIVLSNITLVYNRPNRYFIPVYRLQHHKFDIYRYCPALKHRHLTYLSTLSCNHTKTQNIHCSSFNIINQNSFKSRESLAHLTGKQTVHCVMLINHSAFTKLL